MRWLPGVFCVLAGGPSCPRRPSRVTRASPPQRKRLRKGDPEDPPQHPIPHHETRPLGGAGRRPRARRWRPRRQPRSGPLVAGHGGERQRGGWDLAGTAAADAWAAAGVQSTRARGGDEADHRPWCAVRRAPARVCPAQPATLSGLWLTLALMRSAWQRRRPLARSRAAAHRASPVAVLCF
jgi:hypothetical protein